MPRHAAGLRQAHPRHRRKASDRARSAAAGAAPGSAAGHRTRRAGEAAQPADRALRPDPADGPPVPAGAATGSPTWPARWSGSAVWEPAAGSSCCSAGTTRTPCSSRPRRPTSRYWRPTSAAARTPPRASASSPASGSCRPPATSSWAGNTSRASTANSGTSTCASCGTGRASPWPRTCRRSGWPCSAELCGATLARAHARSGDRIAIAAYLGGGDTFDRALVDVRRAVRRPEREGPPGPGRRHPSGTGPGRSRVRRVASSVGVRRPGTFPCGEATGSASA